MYLERRIRHKELVCTEYIYYNKREFNSSENITKFTENREHWQGDENETEAYYLINYACSSNTRFF